MRIVAATPRSIPVPDDIRAALDTVDRDDLRAVVEQIAVPRVYGTSENVTVRRLITDLFTTSPVVRLGVEVDAVGNIVVGDPRRARVLIGAHYDAVPGTPGADDNASAVAVLLAAAQSVGPHEGVCFVAFNGEDQATGDAPAPRQRIQGAGRADARGVGRGLSFEIGEDREEAALPRGPGYQVVHRVVPGLGASGQGRSTEVPCQPPRRPWCGPSGYGSDGE